MSKVPSLTYDKVIKALQRDGWIVVLTYKDVKHLFDEVLKITIPAHKPIKRSKLSHILKQVRISLDSFLEKV